MVQIRSKLTFTQTETLKKQRWKYRLYLNKAIGLFESYAMV